MSEVVEAIEMDGGLACADVAAEHNMAELADQEEEGQRRGDRAPRW